MSLVKAHTTTRKHAKYIYYSCLYISKQVRSHHFSAKKFYFDLLLQYSCFDILVIHTDLLYLKKVIDKIIIETHWFHQIVR